MSSRDKVFYHTLKADPVRYEAYLERKRQERKNRQLDRDYETERKRKWRLANPEQVRRLRDAHHAVDKALADGILQRPKKCSQCAQTKGIEAHHPSYERSQWLVVIWLCERCHAKEHRKMKVPT